MRDRGPRLTGGEIALLAVLAAWALFPLVLLLARASALHATFTGADGLIGADGVLGADQLQYLAWARDAAGHSGLASDLFTLAPSGHVYLEPVLAVTGALNHAGLSLSLAYLVWKPVAILALFAACVAWGRRFFPSARGARAAVVALSLFLYTPLDALYSWAGLGKGGFAFQLYLLGSELLSADKLWGYVPGALGTALVPVALLALERAVDTDLGRAPARRALRAGSGGVPARRAQRAGSGGVPARRALRAGAGRGPLLVCALAALLASWLHPWQGITLILIVVGLAGWQRLRHLGALALAALAAALPLAYYYALAHGDPAWRLAGHYEMIPRFAPLVLVAGLAPLAAVAALGIRRPKGLIIEQALLLWVPACLITYFVNDSFASHALQGTSLPLAVLMVRGWRRLRLPRAAAVVIATAAVGLVTIPGLAYDARKFVRTADSSTVQYYLPASDARALRWVALHPPAGGVLAPTPFAAVIPSQTGRHVWVGHGYWSADYPIQAREVDRLFGGRMRPARARRFVAGTGARVLVADCAHHADLAPVLGVPARRFGCARVYVLPRRTGRSASR